VGSILGGSGNFYSSCFNFQTQIQQSGKLLDGALGDKKQITPQSMLNMAGGDCLSMQCTGPETGPDASTLSCEALGKTRDAFNTSLKARSEQLNSSLNTLQCKKAKSECVSAELSCLSSKANIVNQQIASIREEYNRNITQMKQQLNVFVNDEGDIQQQDKFLSERMNNDINAGNPGILKLRDATTELVNSTLPNQINAATDSVRMLTQKKRELDEITVRKKSSQTTQCFAQEDSGNYCRGESNAGAWASRQRPKAKSCGYGSWCDFLICRYWENSRIDAGGVNIKEATKVDADNKVRRFASLVDSIMSRSPKAPQAPQNQDQANASVSQFADAVNLFDPGTINNLYGSQLGQFNGVQLNVKDLFIRKLTQCYNKQSQIVDNERRRALGEFGKATFEIKTMENKTNTDLRNTLDTYATHIGKVYAGLTGKPFVPDTGLCKNSSPDTMVNCLQNIQSNLNGLLNREPVALSIPAKSPNNSFLIRCEGLVGCASDMQKARELLEVRKGQIKAAKTSFIQQAKQQTESFTNAIKGRFEASNSMLQGQKDRINQALGSLGGRPISTGKQYGSVVPLKTSQDPNMEGMVEVPDDVVALIASRMNPPLIDSNADGYNDAISSMGQVTNRYDQKLASIQQSVDTLKMKETECKTKRADELGTQMASQLSVFSSSGCATNVQWCTGQDKLQKLADDASSILGDAADTLGAIANLSSSLSAGMQICSNTLAQDQAISQNLGSGTEVGLNLIMAQQNQKAILDEIAEARKNKADLTDLNGKLQEANTKVAFLQNQQNTIEVQNKQMNSGISSRAPKPASCDSVTANLDKMLGQYKREVANGTSQGELAK
jgi:hypothetical protein